MADPAFVMQLFSRLDEATEGNRNLDYAVWTCSGQPYSTIADKAPHYTTSLDAALTLIPGKAHWSVSWPVGEAELIYGGGPVFYETGGTATLALCIAALRARFSATAAASSLPETP